MYMCLHLYQCWGGARLAINFGSWPSHRFTRVNIGLLSCYAKMPMTIMPLPVCCFYSILDISKPSYSSEIDFDFFTSSSATSSHPLANLSHSCWFCSLPKLSEATLKKFLTSRMTSSWPYIQASGFAGLELNRPNCSQGAALQNSSWDCMKWNGGNS